jgi:hypothetical protein
MFTLNTRTALIYLAISAAVGAIGSQTIIYIVGDEPECVTGSVTGLKSEPVKETPIKSY